MATLTEKFDGRRETVSDDQPQATIEYLAEDCANEDEVKALCESTLPLYYGELKRVSYVIEERIAPQAWNVVASFESAEVEETTSFPSIDMTTTTTHVDNSIVTVGACGPKADTSRVGKSNPIDWDGETIKGTDTLTPVFTFKVTETLDKDFVTHEYRTMLIEMGGKVNSTSFCGFAAGAVLFTGASGSRKENLDWEITFSFSVKKAPGVFYVGDILVGLYGVAGPVGLVGPWDMFWAEYEERTVNDKLVQVPVAVYVERIYDRADLNLLGVTSF